MSRLPTIQDLGGLPQAEQARPVGTIDASSIGRAAGQLGAGVNKLADSAAGVGLDENRWDYAKAHSFLQTSLVDQNAATAADTNYGPDEDGNTLQQRHAAAVQGLQDQAAAMVTDPRMRERFIDDTSPIVAESNAKATAHATSLENDASVAYVDQQGTKIINQAITAPDDTTRVALIDSHNQLIDGLVAKGAITRQAAVAAKQNWAHQYATADALHRADTDPQGVINELRAAPGSDDAMVNRILTVEGTGNATGSSATGAGQFTNATWLDQVKRNRPDLAQGASDADILAMRADPALGRQMTGAYLAQNRSFLQSKGLPTDAGSLYLAHFLGPGGAAAVLSADPTTSVKQALTQSLGQPQADKMIAANPTILAGKQVSSVTGWAAAKMGGVVPGGGSIYDSLRPDVREEVLDHAEASLQKQNVGNLADFQMRVANATSEALDTGAVSKPLTQGDFIGQYGAERGPAEFAKYDTQVQSGRAIASMATMTPEQRNATVESLRPQPGDPNYALKAQALEVAQDAQARLARQAADDPGGFAAAKLPAAKDAYKAFSDVLANPQSQPDDKATAAQAFAARTLLDQQHFGIAADAQAIVPKSYVDSLNKTIATAGNSDDPQKRIGIIGQVQQEAAMWGSYWPQVMRQLAPDAQPVVRAIAAGADPQAMTRLLSLGKDEKPAELLKEQDTTKAAALNTAVNSAMTPFLSTLVGRQRDRDFTGYNNLATQLGALYVRDGASASDAAQKAFTDLIGGRYDFRDTYRIPKSGSYSPDDVQAGALAASAIIGRGGNAGGSEGSGLTPDQVFQRNAPYVKPGAATFNTPLSATDEAGFRDWVTKNGVAFDPNDKTPDYDMRGFWQAMTAGDARARSKVDTNDNRMHFPDTWKTPYDLTFSNESQWAAPNAPKWNDRDQLVGADGKVVFDDRAARTPFGIKPAVDDMGLGEANTSDSLSKFGRDGKWITSPDQTGLNLAYGDKFVRAQDGKPLTLSWGQLSQLGKSHVADMTGAREGVPQL